MHNKPLTHTHTHITTHCNLLRAMHSKNGLNVESRAHSYSANSITLKRHWERQKPAVQRKRPKRKHGVIYRKYVFFFYRLASGMLSNLDPTTQKLTTTNQTHKWLQVLHTQSFLFLTQQWHLRSSSQAYSDVRFSMCNPEWIVCVVCQSHCT